jgi:hypothetical protein
MLSITHFKFPLILGWLNVEPMHIVHCNCMPLFIYQFILFLTAFSYLKVLCLSRWVLECLISTTAAHYQVQLNQACDTCIFNRSLWMIFKGFKVNKTLIAFLHCLQVYIWNWQINAFILFWKCSVFGYWYISSK